MYFSRVFWQSTFERAVKTFAQAVLSVWVLGSTPLAQIDWVGILTAGLLAAGASVLTSLAGSQAGTAGDPSLVKPLEVGDEAPRARPKDVVDPSELDEGDPSDAPADEVVGDAPTDESVEVDETPPGEDYEPRH